MKKFFLVLACFFLTSLYVNAEEDGNHDYTEHPTKIQIREFRNGNITALAEYIGIDTPIIMVSVYRRDLTVIERNNGSLSESIISTSYARVVQSHKSEIKVGDIVVFKETKEGLNTLALYQFTHPNGSLFYLISPQIIEKTGLKYFSLKEGRPPVKIDGTYYPADFYK